MKRPSFHSGRLPGEKRPPSSRRVKIIALGGNPRDPKANTLSRPRDRIIFTRSRPIETAALRQVENAPSRSRAIATFSRSWRGGMNRAGWTPGGRGPREARGGHPERKPAAPAPNSKTPASSRPDHSDGPVDLGVASTNCSVVGDVKRQLDCALTFFLASPVVAMGARGAHQMVGPNVQEKHLRSPSGHGRKIAGLEGQLPLAQPRETLEGTPGTTLGQPGRQEKTPIGARDLSRMRAVAG